jgi:hypothetical protein
MPRDGGQHLGQPVRARPHAVDEIGPVERAHEHDRIFEVQLGDDVAAHLRRRGGGVRVDREAGERGAQHPELAVLRPEVVPPLADAVRFVHREERGIRAREAVGKTLHHQALRGHIEQMQAPRVERREHFDALPGRLTAVEVGGSDACLAQAIDLVFHERDQR